jgi:hypothetical protein
MCLSEGFVIKRAQNQLTLNEFIHYNDLLIELSRRMETRNVIDNKPLSSRCGPVDRVRPGLRNKLLASGLLVATAMYGGLSLPGQPAWTMLLPAQAQEAERTLRIPSAIQFPIVFKKVIDSSKAMVGDEVIASLKEDIVIDDELIAPEGSVVIGHIAKLKRSRRLTESVISKNRRFHKGSSMKIELDEIITDEDEHIPIVGCLSKQTADFFDGKQPREVEISSSGELIKAEAVFTNDQKVASQIVNFAASTGIGQLGTAASFGALPVVMGVIGAVEPAMVMSRPMKPDEKHPRVKGAAWGVWTTVPGAPVIQAVAFKGSDLRIEPGDELLAQAHSPYEVLSITSKILRRNTSSVSGVRINSDTAKTPAAVETKPAPGAAVAAAKAPGTTEAKPSAVATAKPPAAQKLPATPATPATQVSTSTKSPSL